MRHFLALLVCAIFLVAPSAQAAEEGVQDRIAQQEATYKVWGAVAYSLRETPHGKDVILTSMFLNKTDRKLAQEMAHKDCIAANIGDCTVVAFVGCFWAVIGRIETTNGIKTVFGYSTKQSADEQLKQCADQGYQCSRPMGGCNYMTETGQNRFAIMGEKPIPDALQWTVLTERGRQIK